ncbi:MAG TPA: 50S ribosomal protein L24 [Nitrospiraceae bacterium]|jgi:large subunit ribosomal protein L24|nr:50S ribosomal protein L24 [Nitrospiraceae bacterium]
MGLGIKKQDTVAVIAGKEKGKKGRVLSVVPSDNNVIVEKINVIKKHMKPNKTYSQGGIIEKEAPLHLSNVMLVCPKCNKPTRIANVILEGGKKVRSCKKCKEVIDQ